MGIGITEALIIIVIGIVFFGGKRLPQLGKSIGESIKGFKQGLKEDDADNKTKEENKDNKNS